MVYVDTVIVAHSNEAEWQKFKSDHTNEAILDRIVVVKVPYNLRLSEEVKIYQKIIRHSDFHAHVAPHTLEVASMFAILSRLEPTPKCDLMTKLKLYNGEEVIEKGRTKKIDVRELRDDAKREGMNGISTRFIMKALDNALSDNLAGNCINPINVREALINMTKETDLPDDTRKQYLEFLQDVLHKEYLELLEKEITKAFVYSYQEQAESLFQNYLDHAEAYVNKTKVQGPQHQGRAAARRGLPQVDRGADRDHRLGGGGVPPGSHRLPVGGEPAQHPGLLPELRAAARSDREAPDDVGARHQPHHHQGAHPRRGADREVQRDGAEPDRQRLLPELRRRRPQVRGEQPLEGLTRSIGGRRA